MIMTLNKLSVHLLGCEDICAPDKGKLLHLMVFDYLFLAQTDTNPPNNSKSYINIHFHLYIYDHDFEQTFDTPTYEVKTYISLILANCYI